MTDHKMETSRQLCSEALQLLTEVLALLDQSAAPADIGAHVDLARCRLRATWKSRFQPLHEQQAGAVGRRISVSCGSRQISLDPHDSAQQAAMRHARHNQAAALVLSDAAITSASTALPNR